MYNNKSLAQYICQYSSRKFTRLIWITLIILSLCFWTHFLYSYTFNYIIASDTNQDYQALEFTKPRIQEFLSTYSHQNKQNFDKVIGNDKIDIENIIQSNIDFAQEYTEEGVFADTTVLLHYRDSGLEELSLIRDQIQSVLTQSVQPKYIWIICYSNNKTNKELERKLKIPDSNRFQIKMFPFEETTSKKVMLVKDAPWLKYTLNIPTEYTWILEPYTLPKEHYLFHTLTLIQSKEYQDTLIGYDTSIILPDTAIHCESSVNVDKSHYVDMVHSSWVLKTSWLKTLEGDANLFKALQLPLSYYISTSLNQHTSIPSVIIPSSLSLLENPSCPHLQQYPNNNDHFRSIIPTVMEQAQIAQQGSKIAILLSNAQHAAALMPLICKMNQQQHFDLHIILAKDVRKYDVLCANQKVSMLHDLTSAYNNGAGTKIANSQIDYAVSVMHVLELIQPKVLIYVQEDDHNLLFNGSPWAQIGLPSSEIKHALWISDLSVDSLTNWNKVKIDLVVVTDKRPKSLDRLLDSINHAHYVGDNAVELLINMDQTADSETLKLVQDFNFNQGEKKVRHRIRKGGLVPAIVESWYPSSDDHYGLILEDDIELSPFFYIWSKYNILKYRYQEDANDRIFGVSLYSPRNLELLPEGRRPFDPAPVLSQAGYASRSPYGSQIPCSWGAVYFPQHWREFHQYLTEHLIKQETFNKGYYNITVPNSRSERWSKSWKKYFIELTYLRGYVMIYPNYEQFESFSTNHLEYGTHMDKNKKARTLARIQQFKVPLMQQDTVLSQLPEQRLPDFEKLPLMDLWGRVRTLEELDHTGAYWHSHVSTCKREIGTFSPKDILCPFEVNVEKSRITVE